MNRVRSMLFRSRCGGVQCNDFKKEWGFQKAALFVACILYLCGAVVADHYDWKSSVPNRRHVAPVYKKGAISPSRQTPQPRQQSNKHNPNDHPINHPHQLVSIIEKASEPTLSRSPSSWYTSHSTDPRLGSFFTDSLSAAATSFTSHKSPPVQPLVARPRSLSSLISPTSLSEPSSTSSNSSVSENTHAVKKKLKSKKKSKPHKTGTPSSTNSTEVSVVAANTELTPGTSRTFLLTPILAYLIPLFVAQMFGMGMIPAAALITFPIFLLPVGLAAAVFLV